MVEQADEVELADHDLSYTRWMAISRGTDGSDPARAQPIVERAGAHEFRHASRPWTLGPATLACPQCDAPVALGGRAARFSEHLDCPFCRHAAPLRDFLSLALPSRPARVEIRMVPRARPGRCRSRDAA